MCPQNLDKIYKPQSHMAVVEATYHQLSVLIDGAPLGGRGHHWLKVALQSYLGFSYK